MREIKFRAWIKDSESKTPKMYYEAQNYDNGNEWLTFSSMIEDDKIELMQFTGLKDKISKEIYEGDIIRINQWGYEFISEVYYDSGCFNVVDDNYKVSCIAYFATGYIEVIGNKFENKELLDG